ncbi:MAG: CHAT domain-containing protein [Proteobacteria bacterium]|nr:CHAT domain-containing protein [Pseudomonadota bacterium]
MGWLRYEDFELKIERAGDGYRAEVLRSPGGEALWQFALPLSWDHIERLIERIGPQSHSPEIAAARELGSTLFESVFAGDIRACFRVSLDRVSEKEDIGLRIKLLLEQAPELADLPWELLLDESSGRFLSLSVETPVVRYVQLPQRVPPLRVELPLEILVMVSSPSDYPALDVERERELLEQALQPLRDRNQVRVTYVESATLSELHRTLREQPFHVFHFIGHGGFDRATKKGILVLKDEQGQGQRVHGHRLATVLQNRGTLHLAVLNACAGARISRADPYAGVATTLIKQGVPAVIAMQFEITDKAALAFADALYSAMVAGLPVDAAVADARTAIYALASDIEWGTPVLYMRAEDGVLFDAVVDTVSRQDDQLAPETRTPVLSREQKNQLVDHLLACRSVMDPDKRGLMIDQLDRTVTIRISRHADAHSHLTEMVETCNDHECLESLLEAVRRVEGSTRPMRAVETFLTTVKD